MQAPHDPRCWLHVSQVPLGVPAQEPGVWQPAQLVHPGHAAQLAWVGVPEQVGPVLKMTGGGSAAAEAVPQQMRAEPVQSSSDLQDCGQVAWQMPLQHSSPSERQSLELAHACGHCAYNGFKHRPEAVSDVSSVFAEVQQISPMLVWQSVLVAHCFGHSFAGRQIGWV
jgi:hypothetical protein